MVAEPTLGEAGSDTPLRLGEHTFASRLIAGTGKYADADTARRALEATGTELVTVAVRRVSLDDSDPDAIWNVVDPARYKLLPNTAGCTTVHEAVRTARLAREVGMGELLKLEVIGDPDKTLFPDNELTLEAARVLLDEGFEVLPYVSDDPIVCRKLEAMGCPAVMPLAAPIGSGLGIRNPANLRLILEAVDVPVIVDAGVGVPSDAARAMELGCDAVLMNSAIARAHDPVRMATAMRGAVRAGREGYLAGRIPAKLHATASSPVEGLIG